MTIETRIANVEAAVKRLAGPAARPAARSQLAMAMADGSVPLELAVLYQVTDGLILNEAEIWDLGDTLGYAGRVAVTREYPLGVAFGWNRSDVVFVLDAGDTMHAGAGSVLAVDSVYTGPESAVHCAPDLGSFLEAVSRGERPWRAARLIDRQAAKLAQLISHYTDRVDARPPLPEATLAAAIASREVSPGAELLAFLGIANGLRFTRTGLEIAGAADLAPVPGIRRPDGAPGAIRVGRVAKGPELIVTAPGWARPSDLVLQLAHGGDPLEAPSFGRLLPVLIGWIGSDAENAP
ncbi:hypothetical protein [Sinorhizobium meliloti]|uniref:Uncharacterized protein n=1 Tax=Rhizobium meliloti TaxID=382 RepID=A0A2J0YV93_RHIML|nr:hypothetical protein [Sinorhizobium meliloti]PJR10707.1 hypothetical protein CEJ86_29060 [Sinorhizobium meliloti]